VLTNAAHHDMKIDCVYRNHYRDPVLEQIHDGYLLNGLIGGQYQRSLFLATGRSR